VLVKETRARARAMATTHAGRAGVLEREMQPAHAIRASVLEATARALGKDAMAVDGTGNDDDEEEEGESEEEEDGGEEEEEGEEEGKDGREEEGEEEEEEGEEEGDEEEGDDGEKEGAGEEHDVRDVPEATRRAKRVRACALSVRAGAPVAPSATTRVLLALEARLAAAFPAWRAPAWLYVPPLGAADIADVHALLEARADGETAADAAGALGWRSEETLERVLEASLALETPHPYADAYLGFWLRALHVDFADGLDDWLQQRLFGAPSAAARYWQQLLVRAAAADNVQLLHEAHVGFGASVDGAALRTAAAAGRANAVRYLLEAGALADSGLALRRAAENGHAPVVRMLLEAGADGAAADNAPLRRAAAAGRVAVVRALLEARAAGVMGARGVDAAARDNEAARRAAARGHAPVLVALLAARRDASPGARGVDVATRDNEALRAAAAAGHTDVLRALLVLHATGAAGTERVDAGARESEALRGGSLEAVHYLLNAHAAGVPAAASLDPLVVLARPTTDDFEVRARFIEARATSIQ